MREQKEEKKTHRVELTQRDLDTLRWIGEQYAVRLDQLQRILGAQPGGETQIPGQLSESATRVWLTRMKLLDALDMEKPFRAIPAFVWLRPAGLRLVELEYKYLKPAVTTLNHHYWCNEVRLFLAVRRKEEPWKSERQLRTEHAQASANKSHHLPDLPDAELLTAKGALAVEVELSEKQAIRLNDVIYRRIAQYYTTWYFCTPQTAPGVEAVRQKLEPWQRDRIQLYSLSTLK